MYSSGLPADDPKQAWVQELVDLTSRVLNKRHEAAKNTEAAHWFQRGSAGASAGVATLTGRALIGSVHGTAAKIIGLGAAAVGLIAAGIAAQRPDTATPSSFAASLCTSSCIGTCEYTRRPSFKSDDASSFQSSVSTFIAQLATIMDTSDAAPPPGSPGP